MNVTEVRDSDFKMLFPEFSISPSGSYQVGHTIIRQYCNKGMAPYCNFKIQLFRYKISSLGKRTVDTYWAQLLPSKTDGPDSSDKGSLGPTKTKESIQKTVYNLHLLQLDSRWGLTLNLKQFLIFILSIFTKLQT